MLNRLKDSLVWKEALDSLLGVGLVKELHDQILPSRGTLKNRHRTLAITAHRVQTAIIIIVVVVIVAIM